MSHTEPEMKLEIADELIAERKISTVMPDDMHPINKILIEKIDGFSRIIGSIVSWLTVPIFCAMAYEVIARYFFLAPTMWAYDVSRMLYGALFMLGAGYTLMRGVHIRADFLYRNWKPRTQAIVDTILYFLCYFPGLIVFFLATYEYALDAWIIGEKGMDTAWMPHMGPIKTAMPVGVMFLLIQGVSEILKCIYTIRYNRWP